MPRTTPTQFLYSKKESMILRSGKCINGLINSKIGRDVDALCKGDSTKHDTPQYGYCKTCFTIFGLFELLEKYHKEIRGETRKIYGNTTNWGLSLYRVIQKKLDAFIYSIDSNACLCRCREQDYLLQGEIYSNICVMNTMSTLDDYAELADYTGYDGLKREKYRMYHKNFFIAEEVEEDVNGEFGYIIARDFEKTRNELLHWKKYFKQEHQSVIDAAVTALTKYKNGRINDDCIGEIIKFM